MNPIAKFDNLTIARGIAALLIVTYHAVGSFGPQEIINAIFQFGYLAVDIFFVMSGFIISHSSKNIFNTITLQNYKYFIIRRLARIYPNHILALFLYTLLYLIFILFLEDKKAPIKLDPSTIIFHLSLTNNILTNTLDWNIPSWSISAEFFSYLVFPVIFLVLSKIKSNKIWIANILSLYILSYLYLSNNFNSIGDGITQLGIYRCFLEFTCGCTIYFVRNSMDYRYLFSLSMSFILGLILLGLTSSNILAVSSGMVLCTCIMVYSELRKQEPTKPRFSVFYSGLMFLGEISYSLYIIHFFVKDVIKLASTEEFLTTWFSFLLYLFCSLLTATLLYYRFEIPTRVYLYNKINISNRHS